MQLGLEFDDAVQPALKLRKALTELEADLKVANDTDDPIRLQAAVRAATELKYESRRAKDAKFKLLKRETEEKEAAGRIQEFAAAAAVAGMDVVPGGVMMGGGNGSGPSSGLSPVVGSLGSLSGARPRAGTTDSITGARSQPLRQATELRNAVARGSVLGGKPTPEYLRLRQEVDRINAAEASLAEAMSRERITNVGELDALVKNAQALNYTDEKLVRAKALLENITNIQNTLSDKFMATDAKGEPLKGMCIVVLCVGG
jgi:hypothetical protein